MSRRFTVEAVPNGIDWFEDVFLEEFTDHAGQRAFRYGARYHDNEASSDQDGSGDGSTSDDRVWPPEDYVLDPYFCFQVYITIDFELDKQKCRTLAAHLINLLDVQAKEPIWEFYIGPRAVLDCVDHSRHEIAHRKTSAKDVPRIYPLQHDGYDERMLAFAFIIDNGRGWHIPLKGSQFDSLHFPDHDGPLWAHFDPRLPSAVVKIDKALLLKSSVVKTFADQLDVEILRIQGPEAEGDMIDMYRESVVAMQLGIDVDDDVAPELSNIGLVGTDQAAPEGVPQFEITKHTGIAISNTKDQSDLQYVVHIPFSCSLEHVAHQFAAAVSQHTHKTFHLEFYAAKSDADALTHLSELQPESFAQNDDQSSIGRPLNASRTYYEEPFLPRAPFKACSILIDRPDFLNVPAVRFLFGAGWPQRNENDNYMETACTRSSDMQAVVNRMVLESNNPRAHS